MPRNNFDFDYCPILSISPSETSALKELPAKDKQKILPLFPLKSWATANELSNALDRVQSSLGSNNKWIADIDYVDLSSRDESKFRPVHRDILKLTMPEQGYRNWCEFISQNPLIIPCLQLRDISQFQEQLITLEKLKRGVVLRLTQFDVQTGVIEKVAPHINSSDNLLIILDLGQISKDVVDAHSKISELLLVIRRLAPKAKLSLSSTSFPDSFAGYYRGCISIHERALFDKVKLVINDVIYSDRGSARAEKQSGGSGSPPPRIDYASRNEWYFIRREVPKLSSTTLEATITDKKRKKIERQRLYTEIAVEIMNEAYWEAELALYANYVIELTAKGDEYGLDSAQKATAVRINKHLHTQLYYDDLGDQNDTDDDWID